MRPLFEERNPEKFDQLLSLVDEILDSVPRKRDTVEFRLFNADLNQKFSQHDRITVSLDG